MATWHQLRNQVPLWHPSKYTVVSDPPHDCRTVMRFETKAAAETFLSNIKARGESHSYILPPANPTE